MLQKNTLHLLSYASGLAGVENPHGILNTANAPLVIQQSPYLKTLLSADVSLVWNSIIKNENSSLSTDEVVATLTKQLAEQVAYCIHHQQSFCVLGGDHTCAIGTWSGVYDAYHTQGDIGLIWIDAHMDSHTPESSLSGRIHGMPLACLLGYGNPKLTSILHPAAKIKPENVCIIGVRSFETGEEALLKQLNVRIYFMEEVKERGFNVVLQEAVEIIRKQTVVYGLSIDIDGLDPEDAPGVGVPEKDGIHIQDLRDGLNAIKLDPKWITTEIVEFDPSRDIQHKTEKLVIELLNLLGKKT